MSINSQCFLHSKAYYYHERFLIIAILVYTELVKQKVLYYLMAAPYRTGITKRLVLRYLEEKE